MYLPSRFKNDDTERSMQLIKKNPLATLISMQQDSPFVSHLPLVAEKNSQGVLTLYGHLARANPHWQLLDSEKVYVIFQGPHSYITSKWYTENDVPTWNYAVVHISGNCQLITDREGIISCLKKLTEHVEGKNSDGWEFWVPDYLKSARVLEQAIVGFSISVESLHAKFKLSQNRSEVDRHGVMRGLAERTDDQSRETLALMREWFSPRKP